MEEKELSKQAEIEAERIVKEFLTSPDVVGRFWFDCKSQMAAHQIVGLCILMRSIYLKGGVDCSKSEENRQRFAAYLSVHGKGLVDDTPLEEREQARITQWLNEICDL